MTAARQQCARPIKHHYATPEHVAVGEGCAVALGLAVLLLVREGEGVVEGVVVAGRVPEPVRVTVPEE